MMLGKAFSRHPILCLGMIAILLAGVLLGNLSGLFVDQYYESLIKEHSTDVGTVAGEDIPIAKSVEDMHSYQAFTIQVSGYDEYLMQEVVEYEDYYFINTELPSGERIAVRILYNELGWNFKYDKEKDHMTFPVGTLVETPLPGSTSFLNELQEEHALSATDCYVDMVDEGYRSVQYSDVKIESTKEAVRAIIMSIDYIIVLPIYILIAALKLRKKTKRMADACPESVYLSHYENSPISTYCGTQVRQNNWFLLIFYLLFPVAVDSAVLITAFNNPELNDFGSFFPVFMIVFCLTAAWYALFLSIIGSVGRKRTLAELLQTGFQTTRKFEEENGIILLDETNKKVAVIFNRNPIQYYIISANDFGRMWVNDGRSAAALGGTRRVRLFLEIGKQKLCFYTLSSANGSLSIQHPRVTAAIAEANEIIDTIHIMRIDNQAIQQEYS